MNNMSLNFEEVLGLAQNMGLPLEKKRGILREYLQSRFISYLYQEKDSNSLSFVGGTSLRLLRNLPRFSEDLDFDNLGLKNSQVIDLFSKATYRLKAENIEVEFLVERKDKPHVKIKFPRLLFNLGISSNPKEKLMIKLDFTNKWRGQKTEVKLLNRFGSLEQVLTNSLDTLLTQKLAAYVNRPQTQPRDMFDIVWLFAHGARIDPDLIQANNLGEVVKLAKAKFSKEISQLPAYERKLKPFLVDELASGKISLLGTVLDEILG